MLPPPGFRGAFRTDAAARALYAEGAGIFRIIPGAVAVPERLDDLITLVRWAARDGTPLVPRGAGSGMPGGNVGPGVVVDLRNANAAPIVDPAARTARVGAAVTWKALSDATAAHGLRLPPNPSSGKFCTIGGMVATNAAGAHTLKYGAMREWVDAIEFVTADGEIGHADAQTQGRPDARTQAENRLERDVAPWIREHHAALARSPAKVQKNSAGYMIADCPDNGWVRHLLIGSEGTLAFITGVEVSLAPLPAQTMSMLVPLKSLDEIAPMVILLSDLNPSALELLDRTYLEFARALGAGVPADSQAALLVELEDVGDDPPSLKGLGEGSVVATDAATGERIWSLRHRASPILAGLPDTTRSLQLIEDGCVPLARLGDYIAGLRRIARDYDFQIVIFGHAGDGHIHANILADVTAPDLAERLRLCLHDASAFQIALGGTTSGEHGDGRLRAPFLEKLLGETYVEGCQRVKEAWDPRGIMNPGVKLTDGSSRLSAGMLKVGPHAPALPTGIAELLRDIERNARWGEDRLGLLPSPR